MWCRVVVVGALALLGSCSLWPFGQAAQPVEELEQLDVVDEDGAFDPSEAVDDEDEPGAQLLDDEREPSDAPAFADEGAVEGESTVAGEEGATVAEPASEDRPVDEIEGSSSEAAPPQGAAGGGTGGEPAEDGALDPAAPTATDDAVAAGAPLDSETHADDPSEVVEEAFDPWILTEPVALDPADAEVVNLAPEDAGGDVEADAEEAEEEASVEVEGAGTAVTTDGDVVERDPRERVPFLDLDGESDAAAAEGMAESELDAGAAGLQGDPLEANDVSAPTDAPSGLPPGEDIATAGEVRELIAAREAELRRIRDSDVDDAAAKVQVARNPEPEERKALEPLGWRLADVALELLVLAGLAALLAGLYTGLRALFTRSS